MSGQLSEEEALKNSKVLFDRKRLTNISNLLKVMEDNANEYLTIFETSSDFRVYRTAFRQFQFSSKLKDIVEFQVCDNADPDQSFYRQNEKKIIMCYNKMRDYHHFSQTLKYNLVLLYDDLRANINWMDCNMLACMKIRAAHISEMCKKADKPCFENHLKLLERNEVCKGKFDEYFNNSFKQCVLDISPINSMQQTKQTIFF